MNDDFVGKLNELKRGYIIKLKSVLKDIEALLGADKINVNELYSKIHTISGTSGMYGLKIISEISSDFEMELKVLKEKINPINEEELKGKLKAYIENMNDILTGE